MSGDQQLSMRRHLTSSPAVALGSVCARHASTLRPRGTISRQGTRDSSGRGYGLAARSPAVRAAASMAGPTELRETAKDDEFLPDTDASTYQPSSPEDLVRDEKLSRLEAVLFLAKEPLPPRKICQFANLANGKEALTLVSRLNGLYDHSARAFRVDQVAGGWQLRTRPQFGSWLRRLQHVPREIRLSAPSMETLAVVAYRQPVVRADIEEVRGVGCGEILRQLMERDLVRVSGRSEELGRPYFYSTTQHFLQVFGLQDLESLPRAEYFRRTLEEQVGEQE